MRDLDAEYLNDNPPVAMEDRSFQWQGVRLIRLQDVPIGAFDAIERPDPNDTAAMVGWNEMKATIAAIRRCLDPACHDDYDRAVQNRDIPIKKLMKLWESILEGATGRPTGQPARSSGGQSGNGTPSTDGRSTTEAWMPGGSVPGASQISPTPTS